MKLTIRWEQHRKFGTLEVIETTMSTTTWDVIDGRRRPRPKAKIGIITYSTEGFRCPDLPTSKPTSTVRVGFFGSSTTLNAYVSENAQTWPAVAMQQLVSAYPECQFDFFNAGINGYSVRASFERLKTDALPYQPDIAIMLLNDATHRARKQMNQHRKQQVQGYKPSHFAKQSILWLKLEKNLAALRLQRIAERTDIAVRLDLTRMVSLLSLYGIGTVFAALTKWQ